MAPKPSGKRWWDLRTTLPARLLFLGLLRSADDFGNICIDSGLLLRTFFGPHDGITEDDIEILLDELATLGLVVTYHDGKYANLPLAPRPKKAKRIECPTMEGQQSEGEAFTRHQAVEVHVPDELRADVDIFLSMVAASNASGRITNGRIASLERELCELANEFGMLAVQYGIHQAVAHSASSSGYVKVCARTWKTKQNHVIASEGEDVRDLSLEELRRRRTMR